MKLIFRRISQGISGRREHMREDDLRALKDYMDIGDRKLRENHPTCYSFSGEGREEEYY